MLIDSSSESESAVIGSAQPPILTPIPRPKLQPLHNPYAKKITAPSNNSPTHLLDKDKGIQVDDSPDV
jgi:hypothetical protein